MARQGLLQRLDPLRVLFGLTWIPVFHQFFTVFDGPFYRRIERPSGQSTAGHLKRLNAPQVDFFNHSGAAQTLNLVNFSKIPALTGLNSYFRSVGRTK